MYKICLLVDLKRPAFAAHHPAGWCTAAGLGPTELVEPVNKGHEEIAGKPVYPGIHDIVSVKGPGNRRVLLKNIIS